MGRIYVGTVIRIQATFKDVDGIARDPATVTLKVRKPSGTVVTVTGIQHPQPGSGVYFADVMMDEAGVWRAEWSSTGNPTVVDSIDFAVYERPISS